jgi:hypothetical protein
VQRIGARVRPQSDTTDLQKGRQTCSALEPHRSDIRTDLRAKPHEVNNEVALVERLDAIRCELDQDAVGLVHDKLVLFARERFEKVVPRRHLRGPAALVEEGPNRHVVHLEQVRDNREKVLQSPDFGDLWRG